MNPRRIVWAAAVGLGLSAAAAAVDPGERPRTPADPPVSASTAGPSAPSSAPRQRADRATATPTANPGDLEDDHRTRPAPPSRQPLLDLLPIELAGARIEPATSGARSRVVRITPGPRGRGAALSIYRRARAAADDRTDYRPRWRRRR